jgi:hypothetical protein
MVLEIFADETSYYVRRHPNPEVMRWFRQGDRWISARERMPARCTRLDFADLPADLQEEVLAFLVRAEAMDNRMG